MRSLLLFVCCPCCCLYLCVAAAACVHRYVASPAQHLGLKTYILCVAEMLVLIEISDSDDDCIMRSTLPKRLCRRRSAVAAEQLGISSKEFRRLKRTRAPKRLLFLMHALKLHHGNIPRDLSVIEMFSGAGHLCTSAWNRGLGALGFEVLDDNVHQDMTSALGFIEVFLM